MVVVREPVPIHAEGFFVMDVDDSVSQVAVFEYLDEGGYYGSWLGVGILEELGGVLVRYDYG